MDKRLTNFIFLYISIFYIAIVFSCCSYDKPLKIFKKVNQIPQISPDYIGITVPPNIAPLNFQINEEYEKYVVKFSNNKGEKIFTIKSVNGEVIIPLNKWKILLRECQRSQVYTVQIYGFKNKKWYQFRPFANSVVNDSIDKYIVYRLIEPGFETWGEMGIYQRCLENFSQIPIIENRTTAKNCMNCHSFCGKQGEKMLFHMREKYEGTVFWTNKKLCRVNTKTGQTISAGVYPAWHPEGRWVAFSTNHIVQTFHALPNKKVEVLDTLSDLVIYDTQNNIISSFSGISSPDYFETFPEWSPDGNSLFFCRAKALPPEKYNEIRYDLYKIDFSPITASFGKLEPVLILSEDKKSITFPRVSPDGKYLLFCVVDYGNFSIWHNESDLYYLDLENKDFKKAEPLNSTHSESYHSWSSSSRWVVFSSRRPDDLYTKPFISYFDENGNFSKPFIVPQKNPNHYSTFLKSYNIPEFVVSKVNLPY